MRTRETSKGGRVPGAKLPLCRNSLYEGLTCVDEGGFVLVLADLSRSRPRSMVADKRSAPAGWPTHATGQSPGLSVSTPAGAPPNLHLQLLESEIARLRLCALCDDHARNPMGSGYDSDFAGVRCILLSWRSLETTSGR